MMLDILNQFFLDGYVMNTGGILGTGHFLDFIIETIVTSVSVGKHGCVLGGWIFQDHCR